MAWTRLLALLGGLLLAGFPAGRLEADEVSGKPYDWTKTRQPERPYLHRYDQTVVMKLFLAEKQPGEKCKVYLTFAQAAEVLRKLDNLTLGMPKIVYLVGWQHHGHDSQWPDGSEVNPDLKRPEDATALDSLKWLMVEGAKYHATVSLHVNFFDAYADSPLWQTYVDEDIIAKDQEGRVIPGEVMGAWTGPETQSYQISYAQEWDLGYTRKRIDLLLAMLPLEQAGTIHIDAFHTYRPIPFAYPADKYPGFDRKDMRISPYAGYTVEQETAAQRKIIRYFRDHGVDVTSEGSTFLRPDAFTGLQPMAWNYGAPAPNIPPSLYCGTPMKVEPEVRNDPEHLGGLLEQFCLGAVPWLNANRGAPHGTKGGNVFLPAPWREKCLVAYSKAGVAEQTWKLPAEWGGVSRVRLSKITLEGLQEPRELPVNQGAVTFGLAAGEGVAVEEEP